MSYAEIDSRLDAGLDAIVRGQVSGSPELSGLQVLVMRNGETVYEYAGGFARLVEAGEVPLAPEHKARIASISKLVATVGLMRLVEAGQVDLDEDVSSYLGFALRNPAFPDERITLRMILSHTSSIRDGSYYWLESGQHFEDFFLPGSEHFEEGAHFAMEEGRGPGRYFTYANLNFGIVAGVIERVSGRRFDRYMRQEVLEPLGLRASYNVCDLSEKYPEQIATLYRKRDSEEVWRPQGDWIAQLDDAAFSCHYGREPVARGEDPGAVLPDYTPGENPTLFSPQGGLRASARDLSVIAGMLMGGGSNNGVRLLDEATVRMMFFPQWQYDPGLDNGNTAEGLNPGDPGYRPIFTAWGLSVQRMDLEQWGLAEQPRLLLGHLGDAYGLMGQFWLDPENGDALIALITGAGDDPDRNPGVSPMYRPSDEIMRWWLEHFPR
ncbi:MAG: serine hydrolase domain-containing protein [Xanthomonadales bacterium]|nr:serine hydrolase domain-containing protein [Xanthomonadales bacterium]